MYHIRKEIEPPMKRSLVKKILKITGIIFLLVFLILGYLLYGFISPSSDNEIREEFRDTAFEPDISYEFFKGRKVRLIKMKKTIDTLLPTLFFIHGSPGTAMDFKRYLKDPTLNSLANIVAYDRIGYGQENRGKVLESLEEEVNLLHQLIKPFKPSKIILVGYSFGGTVVMASEKEYMKKIVLAAAVRGDLQPMFWAMNLYQWKFSRPLVPLVFQGASIEKLRHVTELPAYEKRWNQSPSNVLSIHGKEDYIVPFENSLYLKELFEDDKFSLIPLEEGNHSLIWTNFEFIKTELIKSIEQQ